MQSLWQRGGQSDPVHALAQLTQSVTIKLSALAPRPTDGQELLARTVATAEPFRLSALGLVLDA